MAHMLEETAKGATMAWNGQVPWHGLGKQVSNDLTPIQMMQEAQCDWEVIKVPGFVELPDGKRILVGWNALIRSTDHKILSTVADGWEPTQNIEAFQFFAEYCLAGDMEMHTAGSLDGGKRVWVLAKIKDGFAIKGKDLIEPYLLFTNPHMYGHSNDVRFTPIRVVCHNTLTFALSADGKTDTVVRQSHRSKFNSERAKEILGIARDKLYAYKEMAEFLASRKAKNEDVVTWARQVFPLTTSKDKQTLNLSKGATMTLAQLDKQPGAELTPGTWWSAFNAATYVMDHGLGTVGDAGNERRMESAWYGKSRTRKMDGIKLALEFAEKSEAADIIAKAVSNAKKRKAGETTEPVTVAVAGGSGKAKKAEKADA